MPWAPAVSPGVPGPRERMVRGLPEWACQVAERQGFPPPSTDNLLHLSCRTGGITFQKRPKSSFPGSVALSMATQVACLWIRTCRWKVKPAPSKQPENPHVLPLSPDAGRQTHPSQKDLRPRATSDGQAGRAGRARRLRLLEIRSIAALASTCLPSFAERATQEAGMDRGSSAGSPLITSKEPAPPAAATRESSPGRSGPGPVGPGGGGARSGSGRPAAANAARERSRVQTLRHAFLELQRTLPSVPPDTKLSKLDVLLLATTYIAHLTRSLQDDAEATPDAGLGALRGDGYLHPVKVGR